MAIIRGKNFFLFDNTPTDVIYQEITGYNFQLK